MIPSDDARYPGGIFHASLPDGRIGAEIEITPREIVARPPASVWEAVGAEGATAPWFAIPLSECLLDLGGESGRMVFCRNAARDLTIFSEAGGFAEALGERSGGLLAEPLHALVRREAGEGRRFFGWLVAGALAAAVIGVAGYQALLLAARAAITHVPIAVDERIGAMAMQAIGPQGQLAPDHAASRFVTGVVARLEPHAAIPGLKFRAIVVEDPEVNAYALPGGQIVVYTGLLAKAGSGDQVAGVLAHEMAHATLRHGLEQVGRSMGIVAALQLLVGDAGGLLAAGSQVAQKSILTSYGRGAETEADLEGARMLHEAGLDPRAIAEFFATLEREQGDLPAALAWLGSHPLHRQRIKSIEDFRASLPPREYTSFDEGFAQARQAIGGGG
jgi:Zn-dependent protease with chaperone function